MGLIIRRWVSKSSLWVIGTSLFTLSLADPGFSQSSFYEGKTITIIQATNPGGTGDLRRKALAPYLQKYIPGNPTVLFEYMPGGGGRKAGNYIYRSARPDGLTIGGFSNTLISAALLGAAGVQYDIDRLIYLGTPTSGGHRVFMTRKEAGLNSLEKLRSVPGVRIGAQQVGHETYIIGRLFAYLIGLREPRFVTGYSGPELDLALMQGELDGRANNAATVIQRTREWTEKGLMYFDAIIEVPKGNNHPLFGHLPEIEAFSKSDKERKLLTMQRAFDLVGTPYVLPPGTPKPQVQILQEAMRKALKDAAFHRQFKKLVEYDPTPLMPEELERAIKEIPREPDVNDLFKMLSGPDPLPPR